MSRRKTGVIFCVIAAFLLAVWYITAAIYLGGSGSRSSDDFEWAFVSIGPVLPIFSAIAFIGGILYLIIAEKKKE